MPTTEFKHNPQGLCFRCEHRAEFLETGNRPRYECGDPTMNCLGCYMYLPVKPVVLEKLDPNDPRPQFSAPFISARSKFVAIAKNLSLSRYVHGEESTPYWIPGL